MIVRTIAMIAALAAAASAVALEVEGVRLVDKATVGGQELALNGAGTRKRAIFKVYVGSLYLPAKEGSVVTLDFADGATTVGLDGTARGSIDGAAFNEALTRIWIGEHPAQDDLKKAMLGGA